MTCTISDPIIRDCSGVGQTADETIAVWAANDCQGAYAAYLNAGSDGTLGYNPDNQPLVQSCINQLFTVYQGTYNLTNDVTAPTYNNFQDTLLTVCANSALPGICNSFSTAYCTMSRTDALASPVDLALCGCFVPPDPAYLPYTGDIPTAAPCDPACRNIRTSQKLNTTLNDGSLNICRQDICVINDAVINSLNSASTTGLNIGSTCGGCGGGQGGLGCTCIIAGGDIAATLASVGVGTNLSDFCSPGARCIVEQADGTVISDQLCTAYQAPPVEAGSAKVNYVWVGIFIFVVCLALICLYASRQRRKYLPVDPPALSPGKEAKTGNRGK